jgi:hypothetical protein
MKLYRVICLSSITTAKTVGRENYRLHRTKAGAKRAISKLGYTGAPPIIGISGIDDYGDEGDAMQDGFKVVE